ncbi:ImmA/IrrE family metallo-endopeptidase [Microbacterium foliorum]
MLELVRFAAAQGIELHAAHLDEDVLGYWSPDEGRIYFDLQLTPDERDTTIAHELGHVHYGHRCDTERNERQADTFAASLLIDPRAYAQAEATNPDTHHIAEELGVTVELVEFFETNCLTRLHGVTYAHARHGSRQWAHRLEYA